MATDWLATLGPHGKPALIGAASGLLTGLILKRLVKSLLVTMVFAVAVYLLVSSTTNWLDKVDIAAASRDAVEYAKAHKTATWDAARSFVTDHVASSVGFAAGILGGLALSGRRLWPWPSASQQS